MEIKIENYISEDFYNDFQEQVKNNIIKKALLERDLLESIRTVIGSDKISPEDKPAEIIDVFVSFIKELE